ncbi:MAG: deoxyribonuclease IV [Armatimonadia bacterium]|nr:deoxyribonuclease IV [Armatimonadia bacterium]
MSKRRAEALPKFGYHVSAQGGPAAAVERAKALGLDCMQLFTTSPRAWRFNELSDDDIAEFRAAREKHGIGPAVVHTIYLINLASEDKETRDKAIHAVSEDLIRADALGCEYVVTHVGSAGDLADWEARRKAVYALNRLLKRAEGTEPMLLLENSAGGGRVIGRDFAELVRIAGDCRFTDRIGFCADSAHSFQAGHDVRTREGIDALLEPIDAELGSDRLKVIHLNDSRTELGSNHDRHEHIGQGALGREGMKAWLHHPTLRSLPFILETPIEDEDDDARNLRRAKRLAR